MSLVNKLKQKLKSIAKTILGRKEPPEVNNLSEVDVIFLFFKDYAKYRLLIDVGAHVGESFRPYEKIGWQVYAFEPDPFNRKYIGEVQPNTKMVDFAVSDQDGQEVTLYKSSISSGISSLAAFHPTHKPIATVKTKTLTTFCKEENIKGIDFLKIDAEGFDLHVLRGFPFDVLKPRVIITEFEDRKTLDLGYSYLDLGNILRNNGYVVYLSEWKPIVRYGIKHTWSRIIKFTGTEKLEDVNAWGNFVAVLPEDADKFDNILQDYLKELNA